LLNWNVAVIGGSIAKGAWQFEEHVVPLTQRVNRQLDADRYAIGRLLSPRDEALDLEEVAWLAALDETKRTWHADPGRPKGKEEPVVPSGPALRKIRGFGAEGVPASPETGLLLIYLLNPENAGLPEDHEPVVAFGISFPGNNSGIKVDYKVGHIYWEQEFGSAE